MARMREEVAERRRRSAERARALLRGGGVSSLEDAVEGVPSNDDYHLGSANPIDDLHGEQFLRAAGRRGGGEIAVPKPGGISKWLYFAAFGIFIGAAVIYFARDSLSGVFGNGGNSPPVAIATPTSVYEWVFATPTPTAVPTATPTAIPSRTPIATPTPIPEPLVPEYWNVIQSEQPELADMLRGALGIGSNWEFAKHESTLSSIAEQFSNADVTYDHRTVELAGKQRDVVWIFNKRIYSTSDGEYFSNHDATLDALVKEQEFLNIDPSWDLLLLRTDDNLYAEKNFIEVSGVDKFAHVTLDTNHSSQGALLHGIGHAFTLSGFYDMPRWYKEGIAELGKLSVFGRLAIENALGVFERDLEADTRPLSTYDNDDRDVHLYYGGMALLDRYYVLVGYETFQKTVVRIDSLSFKRKLGDLDIRDIFLDYSPEDVKFKVEKLYDHMVYGK